MPLLHVSRCTPYPCKDNHAAKTSLTMIVKYITNGRLNTFGNI